MGVVTRPDSPYFWVNLEREGRPPLRESTRILYRGVPPQQLRENRREAERIYNVRMTDLARQRVGLPTSVERQRITLRTWAKWYQTHVTPTKRGAAREVSMIAHLVGYFGGWALDRLDQAAVREYMTARLKAVTPGTVNREVDVLKSMLGAAVPKHLAKHPLRGMKRLRARVPEPPVLSHEDEARLLAVLAPADQALIIAALDTLVRLSDLVGLRWAQDHGTHLEIHDPKARPYKVPVSTRLRTALDALPKGSPYVFAHHQRADGGPPSAATVTRMFRFACYQIELPYGRGHGLTWHALRHTGATRAIAAGATLRDLMALGGWADLKSVQRYTRPTGVDLALVDRMSRNFGSSTAEMPCD